MRAVHDDEALDDLRPARSEAERHRCAPVVPDDRGAPPSERPDQAVDVGGQRVET
jgi:hypothetical protein